jgi:hypothetical protein
MHQMMINYADIIFQLFVHVYVILELLPVDLLDWCLKDC